MERADLVIVIGGLGPTRDDLTRPVAAEVLGRPLVASAGVAASIREFLAGRGLDVPPSAVAVQSEVLDGAAVLPNRNGTAPGLWCEAGDGILVLLPGPPGEFRAMVEAHVLPRLVPLLSGRLLCEEVQVAGIPESRVASLVDALDLPAVAIGYCARPEGITVRLEAGMDAKDALAKALDRVREALVPYVLPVEAATLPAAVGQLLLAHGLSIATAESCTGGGIAVALTDVPGSSAYMEGGVVSYANRWKEEFLDVPREVLDTQGAVSEETVHAMLEGLLARYGVDCGIAVSGVAGPGGGTAEKPVGLVYIGTAVRDERLVRAYHLRGDRGEVRLRTVFAALGQLRMQLLGRTIDSTFDHQQR
jgi:nicotinamide-nucleotide amidase